MYLFNAPALAQALRSGRVSEGEKTLYFVVLSVFQSVLAAWRSAAGSGRSDAATYAVSALVVSAGVYVCYRANAAGDGQRFVERYVCLSVPLTIWTIGAGFLISALLMYGAGLEGGVYATVGHIANLLLWAAYFAVMRSLISRAAGDPGEAHPEG